MARPVFFVSDHTGITAEIIGKSLLSQFPGETFSYASLPFVDTLEKAHEAVARINAVARESDLQPLVFSTLTDPESRTVVLAAQAATLDVYGQLLDTLAGALGREAVPRKGQFHGASDQNAYRSRIDAVNFTLAVDDGLATERYDKAELILIGVSRSGKTPTALYMAMQYGLRVANYPLTPENFELPGLPAQLRAHHGKLRGLTLTPERLAHIRAERRPGTHYAELGTCQAELRAADRLMQSEGIPVIDTTHRSVEEIATLLKQSI